MTHPNNDDRILDKVRKLLAKAEDDACTTAEAEAFTAKATELIARYGIDEALLTAADPGRDNVGDRTIMVDAPYVRDKATLLSFVADALRCKVVFRGGIGTGRVHLFGFSADLDRTELLYTSLLVQAAHALAAEWVPFGEDPRAYRRSWYRGFSAAVYRRLKAAEARAEADATKSNPTTQAGCSVALVLADRSTLVARAVADAYPKLRDAPQRKLSGSGTEAGYSAGQRADLGGPRVAPSAQPRRLESYQRGAS